MQTVYGSISNKALYDNITDVINQTFKMLPYKQYDNPMLESHTTSLLFRIRGMSELFPDESLWVTLLSTLQAAKSETDFKQFRKAILDACSILTQYKKTLGDSNV